MPYRPFKCQNEGIRPLSIVRKGETWFLLFHLIFVTFQKGKQCQVFDKGHSKVAVNLIFCQILAVSFAGTGWKTTFGWQNESFAEHSSVHQKVGKWARNAMLQPGVKSCLDKFNRSLILLCPQFLPYWGDKNYLWDLLPQDVCYTFTFELLQNSHVGNAKLLKAYFVNYLSSASLLTRPGKCKTTVFRK